MESVSSPLGAGSDWADWVDKIGSDDSDVGSESSTAALRAAEFMLRCKEKSCGAMFSAPNLAEGTTLRLGRDEAMI